MSETIDPSIEKTIINLVAKESQTLTSKLGGNSSGNLDKVLKSVQAVAANLANELTGFPEIRDWYNAAAKTESKRIMELAAKGKIGWFEASYKAYNLRNKVMVEARKQGVL